MFLFRPMFCIIVITTNNKYVITNDYRVNIVNRVNRVLLLYHHVRFQLFLISHLRMLIPIYRLSYSFVQKQFLVSKNCLITLTVTRTRKDSKHNHLHKNSNHLIFYIHSDSCHDSFTPLSNSHLLSNDSY